MNFLKFLMPDRTRSFPRVAVEKVVSALFLFYYLVNIFSSNMLTSRALNCNMISCFCLLLRSKISNILSIAVGFSRHVGIFRSVRYIMNNEINIKVRGIEVIIEYIKIVPLFCHMFNSQNFQLNPRPKFFI